MKVNVLKDGGDRLEFELKDCPAYFANALRRLAMGQIPVFAIDKVVIYENTSSIFNEFIANRIGLIPLRTPAAGYTEKDEVMFSLDVRGPGVVYSKDLKAYDDKVKVSNERIPLLKLTENQSVRLEGKARLGVGRRHSKFQAGIVSYASKGDGFHLKVESFSQMGAKELMARSADALEKKCEEFEEALGEIGRKKED